MDPVKNTNYQKDTIAAIATSHLPAAISIIRISGDDAFAIANKVFSGSILQYKSHSAHYGTVKDNEGKTVDTALLLVMKGPNSYTGEDSVEIQCHGGGLVTSRVFSVVLEAGARAAEPGEFTKRAYLNGKIDLIQAESVQELISASNKLALKSAEKKLEGLLSQQIKNIQKIITEFYAEIEALVDFPEEEIPQAEIEKILCQIDIAITKLEKIEKTYDEGKIISEGAFLAIIGSPNVGKSSLMNILSKKNRSIVTPIAGTTRDSIEDNITIGSMHYKVVDTAGIRETAETIEKEGIDRSIKAMKQADLTLLVIDQSQNLSIEDKKIIEKVDPLKTIVIFNKIDLISNETKRNKCSYDIFNAFPHRVEISAKEKINIDLLKEKINSFFLSKSAPIEGSIYITNERHKNALSEAVLCCKKAKEGLKSNLSIEFVASDLRHGLNHLATIIGQNITEDMLSSIFSKFCIGK